jgi:hypothetical protein
MLWSWSCYDKIHAVEAGCSSPRSKQVERFRRALPQHGWHQAPREQVFASIMNSLCTPRSHGKGPWAQGGAVRSSRARRALPPPPAVGERGARQALVHSRREVSRHKQVVDPPARARCGSREGGPAATGEGRHQKGAAVGVTAPAPHESVRSAHAAGQPFAPAPLQYHDSPDEREEVRDDVEGREDVEQGKSGGEPRPDTRLQRKGDARAAATHWKGRR